MTKGDARGAIADDCGCAGCSAGLKPFTIEHFTAWSGELVLDNDELWQLEPFQIDFVTDFFAGRVENWLILPEGNGKTTLIAGIVLYHCEHRRMAKVPVAASSRDQAEILYGQQKSFVKRTPRLERLFNGKPAIKCFDGYREIEHFTTSSSSKVYAADDKTADGVIFTTAVIEELHRHKDLKLYRTWVGKARKRKGAQVIGISTAGEPGSDFEETREKIRQLPGAIQRGSFVRAASEKIVIHDWAVPPKADVTDMTVVKAANPFSAVTLETLREDFQSPTMTMGHWSRFKCNLPTRAVRAAVNNFEWDRQVTSERIPEGERILLGLDAAWKWDTFAMVPYWERDPGFRLLGAPTILTPPRNGDSLSTDEVKTALVQIHERNAIDTVVMDITRAEDIASWIRDELGAEVVEWSQSNENAVLEYERFMTGLRVGWLYHTGDRGLTRHVMNAVARILPSQKTRFDRAVSTRQGGDQEARVIDALVAAAMVNAFHVGPVGDEVAELRAS